MTDTLRSKGPWWEMSPYIRNRESFKTHGALSASTVVPLQHASGFGAYGQLPERYRRSVASADYVVYSYYTPIAWHVPDEKGWRMPDVRYSPTTSAHQAKILTCLDGLGLDVIYR